MSDIKDNESVCSICDKHTNDDTETKWDEYSDPHCKKCFDNKLDTYYDEISTLERDNKKDTL